MKFYGIFVLSTLILNTFCLKQLENHDSDDKLDLCC
jgi:hypothetical protein